MQHSASRRPVVLEMTHAAQAVPEEPFVVPESIDEASRRRHELTTELRDLSAQLHGGRPAHVTRTAYHARKQSLQQRQRVVLAQMADLKKWMREEHADRSTPFMGVFRTLLETVERAVDECGMVLTDDERSAVDRATREIEEHCARVRARGATRDSVQ